MRIRSPNAITTRAARVVMGGCVLGAVLFLEAARIAYAQAPQLPPLPASSPGLDPSLSAKLVSRGDLSLRDAPLADALFTIGEEWGVNFVVGKEIQGQVNGTFRDTPLHEILDTILLANGYGYRPVGGSLAVVPLAEFGNLNPMLQRATVQLQYADPKEILETVGLLSSPQGKVQAVASAKSLVVIDYPNHVEMIRRMVDDLDRAAAETRNACPAGDAQLYVARFSPQFVAADALKASVEAMLSPKGKAAIMLPDNRIVVADYEPQLELVRQVVEQLDVPRRQVRITALIYDLDIRDIERLGLNWKHGYRDKREAAGEATNIFKMDSLISVPVNANLPDGTLTFMSLSRDLDITGVLAAMQEARDSRLLADPNVTVLDHEKALMSIVTEVPYQQLTQTQQGGRIGTTEFREAGVKLEVTPHIADDDTIRMEVLPTFSRLAGFAPGGDRGPIIDKREAQTTVRVANRQVFVIGGLRQRFDSGAFNGLPYLKDIKLFHLGALFRGRDTEVRESELVVFIIPEIVPVSNVDSWRQGVAFESGNCLLGQIPTATGGRPPYRPVPCCPPTPMGGPRVVNTPYQPNTCPAADVRFTPTIVPAPSPDEQLMPPPLDQGANDLRDAPTEIRLSGYTAAVSEVPPGSDARCGGPGGFTPSWPPPHAPGARLVPPPAPGAEIPPAELRLSYPYIVPLD